jgi:hypothetical protein
MLHHLADHDLGFSNQDIVVSNQGNGGLNSASTTAGTMTNHLAEHGHRLPGLDRERSGTSWKKPTDLMEESARPHGRISPTSWSDLPDQGNNLTDQVTDRLRMHRTTLRNLV